ncbi:hypothetical protein D9M68_678190 [compost metagenome]
MSRIKESDFFADLNFCSNRIRGYKHLVVAGNDYVPLIIERGSPPLITLTALLPNDKTMVILERNVARAREVSVQVDASRITVFALDVKIISAETTSEQSAEVDFLNLEPLGLKIKGDQGELSVGQAVFSRMEFISVGTIIKIGG